MSFPQALLTTAYPVLVAAVLSAVWQPAASAVTYYWDTNGATPGFGTASGTWGGSNFFSTSSTGVVATTSVTTTILDDLNFGVGSTLGLATGTITVNSAQEIRSLTYGAQSGAITLTGGTITLAALATITTNPAAANITTIESVLAGASTSLTKAGVATSTLALTAANTYTGVTSVTSGTLAIRGANGSIVSSSAVAISGGSLLLDNSTSNNSNRIVSDVTLDTAGFFALTGNAAADTMESFGTLGIGLGGATVTVTQANAGRVATLASSALVRSGSATAIVRGSNLGTQATQMGQLTFGDLAGLSFVGATTLSNAASDDTTKTVRIIPYLVGDTSVTGNGSTFVTYDSTLGIRALDTTNQFTTLSAGYTTPATPENVNSFNGTITTPSPTVNSLRFGSGSQTLGGSGTLTIASGAIMANTNSVIGNTFGSVLLGNGTWNEGIIHVASGNTFTVSAPIAVTAGGGLTKGAAGTLVLNGANTYSGATTVAAGVLRVGNNGTAGDLGLSRAVVVGPRSTLSFQRSDAYQWAGSVSGEGTITKAGTGDLSLRLDNGSAIGEVNTGVTAGTLALATVSPSGSVTLTQMRGVRGGQIAITSGTWAAGNLGGGSGTDQMQSTLTVSDATLTVSNGRYLNGNFVLADGGIFQVTGDRFGFGNDMNFGAPTIEIGSGGTLDIYSTQFGSRIGGITANSTTLLKQTGGTAMFGVTDGASTGNRNLVLSAGSAGTSPGTNTKTAYDLSGGTMLVRGSVAASGTNTGVITNFNFRGGVLAVSTYTAANIGSSTDSADPFANSTDIGTLVNRGGTLAPGGIGTAGRTTITGNYRADSGAFAVDLGGTTQANAFQNGAGSYDFVNVASGSATLGGTLSVALINGYTPPSNTTTLFSVFNSTGTGANLAGEFANLVVATSGNRRVPLADGLSSLLVATNTGSSAATVGGLTNVPALTVSLGGFQTTNAYAGAGTAWDTANAGSWTAFDPGSTSTPATVASGAIARFADDTASTGSIDVSLSATRNVRGIQFASSATGASARRYTISQGGSGGLVLDNAGSAVTIADSSAAGNANTIAVPLTLAGSLEASVTNAATSLTLSGGISGAGRGLTKTGAGTLVLGGSSSYTGATAVNAGTLTIGSGGSVNSTSSLSVAAGARLVYNGATPLSVVPLLAGSGASSRAILGGSGTIATAVTLDNLGDTLSPGNSPGILSFGTSQAWSSYSYDWEVNNFTGTTAGTAFDQVAIIGGLTLSGSAGSFQLNLLSLTAANDPGSVPNFSETTRSWVILTASEGISGFDPTHWSIDPSGFVNPTAGAWSLEQSQSGTDLVLMYTAVVPEPGALALALVGVAGIFFACGRRRASAAKVVD